MFKLDFSEFYCIFYGFLKFLQFSENINENRSWPGPKTNTARVGR
jgi:hypothetical protein